MTRSPSSILLGVVCLLAAACGGKTSGPETAPASAAAPPAQKVGDNPFVPPPIVIEPKLPDVKIDGATASLPLSSAASYGWSAFIALNWPASTAANTRGEPDTNRTFGQAGTPA